ncbi:hypothetical protein [Lysobacter sp. CFH 32150]|uniref:hypothetical protein n=1 Tax=Lysobacter sp. CFH 32150 TaxID=2927128 RepID=UPI001FA6F715|nr:hypothetical protein [Lysobacter sp. CFH 32150]MCI4567212.1 hypothetical protein [Lysobacter sp. CFH 32150]
MPLALKGEAGSWLPVSIDRLDALLIKEIYHGRGYDNAYALRRNIAYSLQHVQYLEQTITDLKLTNVLTTQTWKAETIVGCGIIESLLHFLIVATGNRTTADWETKQEFTGANKVIEGKTYRIDSVVKQKLDTPAPVPMTFDTMLKKAESKKLLGPDHSVYAKLKRLRPLRNRVHLQEITQHVDHDFNAFTAIDQKLMMQVLHAVFTGPTFAPSTAQRAYFTYLEKYLDP